MTSQHEVQMRKTLAQYIAGSQKCSSLSPLHLNTHIRSLYYQTEAVWRWGLCLIHLRISLELASTISREMLTEWKTAPRGTRLPVLVEQGWRESHMQCFGGKRCCLVVRSVALTRKGWVQMPTPLSGYPVTPLRSVPSFVNYVTNSNYLLNSY